MQRPRLRDIIQAACTVTELQRSEIISDARDKASVRARWLIFSIARNYGYSYPQIGEAVGRDSSTVISGVRAVETAMLTAEGVYLKQQLLQVERIAIERSRRFFAKHMVNIPEADLMPVPDLPEIEPEPELCATTQEPDPEPEPELLPPRPSKINPEKDYAAYMRSVDAYACYNMRKALNGERAL